MSSEYRGQSPDPNIDNRRPTSELWGSWEPERPDDEDTQPHGAISIPSASPSGQQGELQQPPAQPAQSDQSASAQFAYREHVTGSLPSIPLDAPLFRPAYVPYPPQQQPGTSSSPPVPQAPQGQIFLPPPQQPQQVQGYPPYPVYPPGVVPHQMYPYPGYPGYGYPPQAVHPGYNGYPAYYGWQPLRPKRDGFKLAVSIISLIGSSLAALGGLLCAGLFLLFLIGAASTSVNIPGEQYYNAVMTLIAFVLAGVVGGGFSLYHSIRALLQKPSVRFALPWFWIFLVLYLIVLGISYALRMNGQELTYPLLTVLLIILAAIFPALTLAALGARRLRTPEWSTTWRRFTVALSSGATLAIGLALLFELGFLVLLVRAQEPQGTQAIQDFQKCISDPNLPGCSSFAAFNFIFIVVAIIGPVVEETVKPLAVAFYIGRVRSAAEAFMLGMAAGIGFAVVETVGYIGSGYHEWLNVAIERTGACLLHGFGAAMVTLGWYYLVHGKERRRQRLLKALSFWAYAVFQHFVWNGTAVLSYLPAPYGPTLNSWNVNLGFTTLSFLEILNVIEAILILVFFIYMTGRLRRKTPPALPSKDALVSPREVQMVSTS